LRYKPKMKEYKESKKDVQSDDNERRIITIKRRR
jgi:hypothetical protein